ncbi:MAG TPA: PAS domain S-box protein, partial [bacterium]|nr:PAS domain S-box protein [bacterium]
MKKKARTNDIPDTELELLRERIQELESACEEREDHEQHLQRERDFLRLLVEATAAYFVAIDAEGRIVRMNDSMLQATGYTEEEVRGSGYADLVLPDEESKEQFRTTMKRIVGRHDTVLSENWLVSKAGARMRVRWHGKPLLNDDGEMEYFFGVGMDVTEHRDAEERLRSKRVKAQEYLDLAGVVFLNLDCEGRVSKINAQGCEVLGGSEADILGLNWAEKFVPEKHRRQVEEVFSELMAGNTQSFVGDHENEIVTLNGEKRVIEWHNAVERDSGGNIVGTMSSGIDITDRKHAEDVQRLAYKIGSAIHTADSVQDLFDTIRLALGDVMNTENLFIALYNSERDTLSLSYFVDEKDQDDFDSFPAGKTLTGYIIKHDQSLLIDRSELDKWTAAGVVDMVGTPSLIWLGVPLRVRGEVIGALVVQSYTDRSEFGEADKEMLEFVSEQIGFAIEHKRAEDELLSSEAKNRAILDALPDMIFRMDRNHVFLSYDAAGDEHLAMRPDLFLGKTVSEVFPPEFAERITTCSEKVFQTGGMQLLEYKIPVPFPTGDLREFEARMVLSGDDTVLSVVRDITENKRADQFLRTMNDAALAMEQKMRPDEIFAAAAEELSEVGMVGTIFLMSEDGETVSQTFTARHPERVHAVERLLGTSTDEMVTTIDEVDAFRTAVRERRTVLVSNMVEFLRQMLPLPKKKFAPKLQSTLAVSKTILAPMVSDDRVIGVLSVSSDDLGTHDINAVTAFANQLSAAWRKATLMKELEVSIEELRETQDQLLQSQKMEAVGRLAGGVAHDFNNLLTAISGYAELLSCDTSLGERVHGDIEQIRRAADQAAALTRQLLAFSRRQPLQPVVIDLNRIVVDMNAMLCRLIGEDIELVTTLCDGSARTKVDPGQLEQVIINLAVNARDAMPEGGRL